MGLNIKKMKVTKLVSFTAAILSVFYLTACSKEAHDSNTSSKKENTSLVKKGSASAKSSSVKGAASSQTKETSTSSENASEDKTTTTEMDLAQIKAGDYTSIEGTWHEIGHGRNYVPGRSGTNYQIGGNDVLQITKDTLKASGMSMSGQTLTDNNKSSELRFKQEDGKLVAEIADPASVAINWSVTFYPKNSTYDFSSDGRVNKQNIIVVWTSNNQYTQIFAQEAAEASTESSDVPAKTSSKLNLDQIANDNFSSLVGTWKNPVTGETIGVTDKVEHRPADVPESIAPVGAVIAGQEHNGHPNVILPGRIMDGYMLATWSNYGAALGGSPLTIVPAGVKERADDDSDTTKDRLIKGGGQAGFKENAYYREN